MNFPKLSNQIYPPMLHSGSGKRPRSHAEDGIDDNNVNSCYRNRVCWIQPSLDSIPGDFCQNTSLHGLKYISQPKRHLTERLFWLVTFLVGLSAAIYLISDVWRKYNDSPIIVSFDPYETSIESIPFPAITICNNNKILKSKADVYTEKLKIDDEDQDALINYYYLTEVCLASNSFSNQFGFSLFDINETLAQRAYNKIMEDNKPVEIQEFLRSHSQTCTDMIPLCLFKDESVNCSQFFNPIVTDFGCCCTFNMMPNILRDLNTTYRVTAGEEDAWNNAQLQNSGILTDSDKREKYPLRQTRAGKSYGLSFILDPDLDEYFCKNSDSYGFKLSIHSSTEIPNSIDFGYGIQPNAEVAVAVRPEITKADPSIHRYPLNNRQCYLDNEFNLNFYKYYTPSNCIDECVTDFVYSECGCVRFYMPRNSTTRKLCPPSLFNCTETAKEVFSRPPNGTHDYGLKRNCQHCRPLCSEISFTTQMSASPLTMTNETKDIWTSSRKNVSWETHKVSIVHIYYDQDATYARLRKELYGFTDLVANTGGLMGLCLGFSSLSAVEIIYFLTLRNLWERKRKHSIKSKVVQLWRQFKMDQQHKNPWKKAISRRNSRSQYRDQNLNRLRDNIFMVAPNNKILNTSPHPTANNDLSIIDLLPSKSRQLSANDYYKSGVWRSAFD